MAMIGHALLAVLAATARADQPAPTGMIALTLPEIRRLFIALTPQPAHAKACPLAWSSLAATSATPRPPPALPAPTGNSPMAVTIYNWSTNPQSLSRMDLHHVAGRDQTTWDRE
jgi:hypothetical protein